MINFETLSNLVETNKSLAYFGTNYASYPITYHEKSYEKNRKNNDDYTFNSSNANLEIKNFQTLNTYLRFYGNMCKEIRIRCDKNSTFDWTEMINLIFTHCVSLQRLHLHNYIDDDMTSLIQKKNSRVQAISRNPLRLETMCTTLEHFDAENIYFETLYNLTSLLPNLRSLDLYSIAASDPSFIEVTIPHLKHLGIVLCDEQNFENIDDEIDVNTYSQPLDDYSSETGNSGINFSQMGTDLQQPQQMCQTNYQNAYFGYVPLRLCPFPFAYFGGIFSSHYIGPPLFYQQPVQQVQYKNMNSMLNVQGSSMKNVPCGYGDHISEFEPSHNYHNQECPNDRIQMAGRHLDITNVKRAFIMNPQLQSVSFESPLILDMTFFEFMMEKLPFLEKIDIPLGENFTDKRNQKTDIVFNNIIDASLGRLSEDWLPIQFKCLQILNLETFASRNTIDFIKMHQQLTKLTIICEYNEQNALEVVKALPNLQELAMIIGNVGKWSTAGLVEFLASCEDLHKLTLLIEVDSKHHKSWCTCVSNIWKISSDFNGDFYVIEKFSDDESSD